MCKISGVTKITDKNRDDVWTFMKKLGEAMSGHNNDGLGYAAFDKSGNLFGERWLHNDMAFMDFSRAKAMNPKKIDQIYNYFGDKVLRNEAQAIILHTRMATCAKNIQNTHPFINKETNPTVAIIHNGVISNHHQLTKKFSTCDSEVLVHSYEEHKVSQDLSNIKKVAAEMYGWYTVLNLSKDKNGEMIMDAYTDSPRLSSFYIKELETRVYATAAYDIQEVAKELGYTAIDQESIKANTAMRINVLTGEVIEVVPTIEKVDFKLLRARNKPTTLKPGVIVYAHGSFDDDKFRRNFLKRSTDV